MSQITRIIQLTDLHLFADQHAKLVDINPLETLQYVLDRISEDIEETPPDLILLTGDISQDYSLESYKTVEKIFKSLPYPVVATMGNHDKLDSFKKTFGEPNRILTKISETTNWRIIVLNSNWPQHVDGQLANYELEFLKKGLEDSFDQSTIIFLHHHVLPLESTWLNKIMLNNNEEFLELIDQYKNVKAVVCGHVHQESLIYRNNVTFLSTPSTCWQFKVKSDGFKLDTLMPGYRWINLHTDGTFQSEVVRIEHNDKFIPDVSSKGY